MPLYEYQCNACGQRHEVIQRFSDAPLAECPSCGGSLKKLLSSPAIQFKGSGFYKTDYAGGTTTKSDAAKSDGTPETKSDTKTETKSETKSDAKAAE